MRFLIVLLFVFLGFVGWQRLNVVQHPDGVLIAEAPQQQTIQQSPWQKGEYHVQPLAKFSLQARVISKQKYSDRGAGIAPFDLVLGWREMSDQAVLSQLKISQVRRWWQWRTTPDFAGDQRQINRNASNMHIIPANKDIEKQISRLRRGELVSLSGYLVAVRGPDEFTWNSSLSREDTGDGACELFWVDDLQIITP